MKKYKHKTAHTDSFKAASRLYSDTSILMHEAIARKAGLSGTDHKYLGLILQAGAVTAGEIAHLTGLTTGAVTGLIDRLEKKQLVKREYLEQDRRKVMIVPDAERVMKLLTPLFANLQEQTSQLIQSFSAAELATIERYFRAAVDMMQSVTQKLNTPK